ncbi:MAG: prepilin-type N-terminal cleavage/methylation domain-containing protein [Planctomycetes bacterium]|nr:prepilin-type N-terminal cleavage/methylation domain-containing protein [Planctomycetota bacterium]
MNRLRGNTGMTLLEVLVAFIIFLMLMSSLVALATAGLDTWTAGEERKDVFDRAQRILDQIGEDLRNTFADERWYVDSGGREIQHAHFTCDLDGRKAQRLRFVRAGDPLRVNVDPRVSSRRPIASLDYGDLWEVAYVLDPDPQKPHLYRGVRFFDRAAKSSILQADLIASMSSPAFRRHFRALDTGVLWIGFRFWTPATTTWAIPGEDVWVCPNAKHPRRMTSAASGKCADCARELERGAGQPARRSGSGKDLIGPSLLWDSSRCLGEGDLSRFVYHRSRKVGDDPDFCYPEIAQVTLVVESQVSETRGARLTEGISDSESVIRLDTTRGMPDGPAFLKLDGEWIEYADKTVDGVRAKRRGARGTTAAGHPTGARARFGETFVMEIHVPAFREVER